MSFCDISKAKSRLIGLQITHGKSGKLKKIHRLISIFIVVYKGTESLFFRLKILFNWNIIEAIKKGKGHNGPWMLLVGAISRSFAGFTQWFTLAGTLLYACIVEVKTLSYREDDNNKQNLNNDGGDGNNNGQENQ